jgi:type IV secretory pathway VirJ component
MYINFISIVISLLMTFSQDYKKIVTKEPTISPIGQNITRNIKFRSENSTSLSIDFPVKLIPASNKSTLPMVFFVSGDGGWNNFNKMICDAFSAKGMPVVWLNSQKYFWNSKTPEETALEVSNSITKYLQVCEKKYLYWLGILLGLALRHLLLRGCLSL